MRILVQYLAEQGFLDSPGAVTKFHQTLLVLFSSRRLDPPPPCIVYTALASLPTTLSGPLTGRTANSKKSHLAHART